MAKQPSPKDQEQPDQKPPYQLFPDLDADDYRALKDDIRKRGVQVAIEYDDRGAILDGHHRLRALAELGREGVTLPPPPSVVREGWSEAEKRLHVRHLNILRRHLTQEQKRDLIRDQIKESPKKSDRQLGRDLGVDGKTVAVVRHDLESSAEIPQIDDRAVRRRGQSYTQQTAKIGRFQASDSPEAAPTQATLRPSRAEPALLADPEAPTDGTPAIVETAEPVAIPVTATTDTESETSPRRMTPSELRMHRAAFGPEIEDIQKALTAARDSFKRAGRPEEYRKLGDELGEVEWMVANLKEMVTDIAHALAWAEASAQALGPELSQHMQAFHETVRKRRSRPQMERAKELFTTLNSWHSSVTEEAFSAVEDALGQVEDALDALDDAEGSEKAEWRSTADFHWEDLEELANELEDALVRAQQASATSGGPIE